MVTNPIEIITKPTKILADGTTLEEANVTQPLTLNPGDVGEIYLNGEKKFFFTIAQDKKGVSVVRVNLRLQNNTSNNLI